MCSAAYEKTQTISKLRIKLCGLSKPPDISSVLHSSSPLTPSCAQRHSCCSWLSFNSTFVVSYRHKKTQYQQKKTAPKTHTPSRTFPRVQISELLQCMVDLERHLSCGRSEVNTEMKEQDWFGCNLSSLQRAAIRYASFSTSFNYWYWLSTPQFLLSPGCFKILTFPRKTISAEWTQRKLGIWR